MKAQLAYRRRFAPIMKNETNVQWWYSVPDWLKPEYKQTENWLRCRSQFMTSKVFKRGFDQRGLYKIPLDFTYQRDVFLECAELKLYNLTDFQEKKHLGCVGSFKSETLLMLVWTGSSFSLELKEIESCLNPQRHYVGGRWNICVEKEEEARSENVSFNVYKRCFFFKCPRRVWNDCTTVTQQASWIQCTVGGVNAGHCYRHSKSKV